MNKGLSTPFNCAMRKQNFTVKLQLSVSLPPAYRSVSVNTGAGWGTPVPGSFPGHWSQVLFWEGTPVSDIFPGPFRGTPVLMGVGYPCTGYPKARSGWGTPWPGQDRVPPWPGQDGVPPPPGQNSIVSTCYAPPPPPGQNSIVSTCYAAGGMPLAFTQKDYRSC